VREIDPTTRARVASSLVGFVRNAAGRGPEIASPPANGCIRRAAPGILLSMRHTHRPHRLAIAPVCVHEGFHSGQSRYSRETGRLRHVVACDDCLAELYEVAVTSYRPRFEFSGPSTGRRDA
jgi:hypothetical protein